MANETVTINVDAPVTPTVETNNINETTFTTGAKPEPNRRSGRPRKRSNSPNRSRSPTSRNRTGSEEARNRVRRDTESAINDAVPLLPEGAVPRQKPPLAGPEIDDDHDGSEDNRPTEGIDDGFFTTDAPRSDKPLSSPDGTNGFGSRRRDSIPASFPYGPPEYGGPGIISIPGESPRVIPDVNIYQHKKTLAQGMMDLALLSANANQLRYVLESGSNHPYYYFSLSFISISLILQVLVGLGLVMISRYNVKNEDDICKADRYNNMVTIGILLITIVNVFVSAFGVADSSKS